MRSVTAGAIGGLVAGAVVAGLQWMGKDAGLLQDNLSETTQDWLQARFGARERLGDDGLMLLEEAGHYGASLGLGAAYGVVRPYLPLPGVLSGALFGAGVYAVAVAGVLPELGITQGERRAAKGVPTERFAVHVLYGAIIGVVADALNDRRVKVTRHVARVARED